MPSALSGIMGILKPLTSFIAPMSSALGLGGGALGAAGAAAPAAAGAALAPETLGLSLIPAGLGLASSFMQPGGIMGGSTASQLPSVKAPAMSSAPIGPPAMPDIPSPAGSGLSLSVPGAQPSSSSGAGTSGDISNLIAQAMGTGGSNPFAAYGS